MSYKLKVVLATRNRKKAEELKKIFGEITGTVSAVNILTLQDFPGCPDVVEDGKTFEANAVKKALHVAKFTGMTAIADDSGLEVDALNGAPGVLSARYAGEPADDKKNNEKLLKELQNIPDEKRTARFVCCIASAFPDGDVKTFFGFIEGKVGRQQKGENGFGYDPVFHPEGSDRTFAEISDIEKNAISHRGKAIMKLTEYLKEKGLRVHGFM